MNDQEWVLDYLREAADLADSMDYGRDGWRVGDTQQHEQEFNRRFLHIVAAIRCVAPGLEKKLVVANGRMAKITNQRVLSQAIYSLEEGLEVTRRLGPPPGPTLRADSLHPMVWDAAMSFWRSNHRRKAVEAAASSINAALQNRLGRRDVSNTDLVNQAFTRDDPRPGKPRLRLWPDDGSDTYKSIHDGARSFGVGCFQALRNVPAHETFEDELPEQEALEQLAAFSVLARWIEAAELVRFDSVVVDRAMYGDFGEHRQCVDVTHAVQAHVQGGRLDFVVSNEALGGDPVPNVLKQLQIEYRIGNARKNQGWAEGDRVILPPPG